MNGTVCYRLTPLSSVSILMYTAVSDLRYYKGTHKAVLVDLYGGDYYVDSESRKNVKAENNALAQDANWKNEKLKVGDVVYRNYDGFVTQEGVFGQVEFNRNALATFIAGSVSNTMYWRYDRFYYDKAHGKIAKRFWSGR